MHGYILNTLTDVDEEFIIQNAQAKRYAVRTYKASDNENSDFDKYCRILMATLRIAVLQQRGKETKIPTVSASLYCIYTSVIYRI